jgi:hypothetical protein
MRRYEKLEKQLGKAAVLPLNYASLPSRHIMASLRNEAAAIAQTR